MFQRYTFLLILIFALKVNCQVLEVNLENISIADGLSSESINAVYQDSKGFLWISTNEGLNKYDGYELKTYHANPSDSTSIAGSTVFFVSEDKRGNFWVTTNEALHRYDYNNENFEVYKIDPANTTQNFYNGTTSILEDKKGDFWVGKAYHGLTRFDRKSKTFERVRVDTSRGDLKGYVIVKIVEDRERNIWYTRGNNNKAWLCKVNKERTSEIVYTNLKDKNVPEPDELAFWIILDNDKTPWIVSKKGKLLKYNFEADQFEEQFSLSGYFFTTGYMSDDNTIWIGTLNHGLIKYNIKDKQHEFVGYDPAKKEEAKIQFVSFIYKDRSGVYWVGTRNEGVYKFDPNREPFALHTISNNGRTDGNDVSMIAGSYVYQDYHWLASWAAGLYVINTGNGRISNASVLDPGLRAFSSEKIRSVYEDKKGNLWVGVWEKGLYKYNLNTKSLKKYKYDPSDNKSLTSNEVKNIYQDNSNKIWISTARGLNRYNSGNDHFDRFKVFDSTFTTRGWEIIDSLFATEKPISEIRFIPNGANITKKFKIASDSKYYIFSLGEMFNLNSAVLWDYGWIEDSEGNIIWLPDSLNTHHAGGANKNRIASAVIDLKKGNYQLRYRSDDSHTFGDWNSSPPENETYWGISLFRVNQKLASELDFTIKKKTYFQSIPDPHIRDIYQDSKGNYWIGTDGNGLTIFNEEQNKFTLINNSTNPALPHNRVNGFLESSVGDMWITSFGGLSRYNYQTGEIKNYSIFDGLPTNLLIDILEDEYGNLWISSLRGLIKFEPDYTDQIPTFINYEKRDGLQGYEFFQGAKFSSPDGRLYFGGQDGMNSFYPGQINHNPPHVTITEFKVLNQIMLPGMDNSPLTKNIANTKYIELSYSQNTFSFEFVGLHYSKPDKNQYAYILEGFDKEWIQNNRRFASYTNLDPGEYIFKVKSANSDGIWNEHGRAIFITINTPWWRTVWAYLFYGFFTIGFIFTFDRIQKRRLLRQEEEKRILEQAELRAEAAELQAKAAEAQAKVIQAENERKTKELEEARELQLSMLPKELPNLPNLDIAVFMKTATEVGGDYYDFHIGLDGTLTVVCGDATGHGLNAGTMVTATKSLFSTHAGNPDILQTFSEITRVIKGMRFRMLSMCLAVLKIKGSSIRMSSAGMPPLYLYRKSSNKVEEILMRGMPLGVKDGFPYEMREAEVAPGDIILMLSDGFPELFDENRQMMGYKKVEDIFSEAVNKEPEEIIAHFNKVGDEWRGNEELHDDVTFVVIKVK